MTADAGPPTNDPEQAAAHLRALRERDGAAAALASMSRLEPAGAIAAEALAIGLALKREGQLEGALASFAFAVRGAPEFDGARLELAALLVVARRFHEAIPHFEFLLARNPRLANAWLGLAQCHLHLGDGPAALTALDRIGGPWTTSALFAAWRGHALRLGGLSSEALEQYARAIEQDPRCYDAYVGRALVRDARGELPGAAEDYAAAHRLLGDVRSLGQLVDVLQRQCAWTEAAQPRAALLERLLRGDVDGYAAQWIALDLPGVVQRRIAERFARAQAAVQASVAAAPPGYRPAPRIRIAYLSADFCDHPTSRLIVGLLERHDRARFEVFGYALRPPDSSLVSRRCVAACEHFVDATGWSPQALAQRMRDDGIGVLVDLMGHTRGSLPGLLALRPAPAIVNWLGFPGTAGAFADYVLVDRHVAPPGSEDEFSEALIRLPGCYQPNDPRREIGPPTTRAAQGLPSDAIVACSFNQCWKLGPAAWRAWMAALAAQPRMVLWLLEDNPWATERLRDAAQQSGIDPRRVVFAPRVAPAEHLARLALADLALDTWPCNSHTTASDALWTGVPLLSLRGRAFQGRVAESVLHAVGLRELVAPDEGAYATMLLSLVRDPRRLASLRAHLIEGRARAPLWDAAATARNVERAFVAIVERLRSGAPPGNIDLD